MITAYIALPIVFGFISEFYPRLHKLLANLTILVQITLLLFVSDSCSIVGNYTERIGIELCINSDIRIFTFSILVVFLSFLNLKTTSIGFFVLAAVLGITFTNDIFNLFVWFELLIVGSMLLPLSGKVELKALFKYAVFSILSGFMFLVAIGIFYKAYGILNLNIAALTEPTNNLKNTFIMIFFISMATKSGIIPFHYWLGATYHKFEKDIMPLFLSLFTKIPIFAFAKVMHLLKFDTFDLTGLAIQSVCFLSLHIGFLLAIREINLLRGFAFYSISKSGFLFLLSMFVSFEALSMYFAFEILILYFFLQNLFSGRKGFTLYAYMFSWFGLPLTGFFFANLYLFLKTFNIPWLTTFFIFNKIYTLIFGLKQVENLDSKKRLISNLHNLIFILAIIILSYIAILRLTNV